LTGGNLREDDSQLCTLAFHYLVLLRVKLHCSFYNEEGWRKGGRWRDRGEEGKIVRRRMKEEETRWLELHV
jgi:hypothetical protein